MRKDFAVSFLKKFLPGVLLCIVTSANATHIVGGELYYRYLGNNSYEVTLIVYRDCENGVPPFDNPASIGIFNNPSYTLVTELLLSPLDSVDLPPSISSPCFVPPVNICYHYATYRDTVQLPVNGSGYWLVYQRCCRNNSILNIVNPEDRGATYTAFIPGTSVFSQNSNPVYTDLPPSFICLNIPFTFNHSAIDAEGDSIVYEICTPLDFNGFQGNPIPQPPDPPPYIEVPWESPYDINNVLGGVPMSIDPHTGELTCTPNTIGQFVFGICANEYRNGIYLSTTRRDYQVNVVPCSTIVIAALQNPILNCDDNSVTFVNQSVNANIFSWDFGDPSNPGDTSNAVSPVYVYPDTGTYTVRLIAYSSINPNCNDTVFGTVYVYPGYAINASVQTTVCNLGVQFTDTSVSEYATISWNWYFDDGNISTLHNPFHVYSAPGIYQATLIATNEKGCKDTVEVNVDLNFASASITSMLPVNCNGECNGEAQAVAATGIGPFIYQWNDPFNQTTDIADSLCSGTYVVTITDSLGCQDTAMVNITQPDPLVAAAIATTDYCRHECLGYGFSSAIGGNGGYIYSWDDPQNQDESIANGLCEGSYTVLITDAKGCADSASVYVPYLDSLPELTATASPDTIFEGQSAGLFSTHAQGYIYGWNPSSTLNSSVIADPVSTPPQTTQYIVEVIDSNGCRVTDTVTVWVKEVSCREPEVFIPNAFTPNGDNENDILKVRGSTIESLYFAVYDRWGEIIFETENQNNGWDGIYNGKTVTPGVFVYYLKAVCYDKSELSTKGNITVIR
jgi:gliding motility-associated-like protein